MVGWNPITYPMQCTLLFKVPERGEGLPACDVFWYEGQKNYPELPPGFDKAKVLIDAPTSGGGSGFGKDLPPGKEIYGDGFVFKGGSHGATLTPVGPNAKELAAKLPAHPKSPCNHYKNFLLGVKGQAVCNSPFSVAAPLCQFMALGVIATRVNAKVEFDLKTRRITNHQAADALLCAGEPPRKGWEDYFKV